MMKGKRKAAGLGIDVTAYVWKEAGAYIACSPELDTTICGDSAAQACTRLREALTLLFQECLARGTLEAVLSEAGFEKRGSAYRAHRIFAGTKLKLVLPLAS